jgi:Domain of unknown function (DUF4411)
MLYLIDANTLISAKNTFYKFTRVPEFWTWLKHHGAAGNIKLPREIYDEITVVKDELAAWIKDKDCKQALLLKESVSSSAVQRVLAIGYAPDLTEDELERIGQDPFLIAYALNNPSRCVVTKEVSKPSAKRANRKIPDVCAALGVQCISDQELLDQLDFRTDWDA